MGLGSWAPTSIATWIPHMKKSRPTVTVGRSGRKLKDSKPSLPANCSGKSVWVICFCTCMPTGNSLICGILFGQPDHSVAHLIGVFWTWCAATSRAKWNICWCESWCTSTMGRVPSTLTSACTIVAHASSIVQLAESSGALVWRWQDHHHLPVPKTWL